MLGITQVIERYGKGKLMFRPKRHKSDKMVAKWTKTEEEILVEQGRIAIGSEFKAFETNNFGWLVFAPGTKLVDGSILQKRIYKW
jgi:hypothetical protein